MPTFGHDDVEHRIEAVDRGADASDDEVGGDVEEQSLDDASDGEEEAEEEEDASDGGLDDIGALPDDCSSDGDGVRVGEWMDEDDGIEWHDIPEGDGDDPDDAWRFEAPEYVPGPPEFAFDDEPDASSHAPLYPDASITILATCAYLVSYSKTHGISRDAMESLLQFLGDHVLPRENKLPRTWWKLQAALPVPSLRDATYRMCPIGCFIWRKKDEERLR